MASLVQLHNVSKSFSRPLFTDLSFGVHEGERIGLIGPNGSGKSTLLRMLAGLEEPDSGLITVNRGLRIGYVAQTDSIDDHLSIVDYCAARLQEADNTSTAFGGSAHDFLSSAQLQKISELCSSLHAGSDQHIGSLSGGQRKRLVIQTALWQKPELLLLDEPTNHLDIDAIRWLEQKLTDTDSGYIVISHDRLFLENVTNRIIEINRAFVNGFFSTDGGYATFLERKHEFLSAQKQLQSSLANRLRKETEWLRRMPKARTTKAQYRIDAAEKLKDQLASVKDRNLADRRLTIEFDASNRQTKRLIECSQISKSMGGRLLFENLDIVLSPKTCIGLMGSNGSGKTTLMKILTGETKPDQGSIKHADQLEIVYFDQKREMLDQNLSLRRALAPAGDTVIYQGRSIHVAGFAKMFLFDPSQLERPISTLSGGERARILIARLMQKPADVLLLDEPTNDLDIESLEVFEESIEQFAGAVVLISHDRFFLNRLSSSILSLDGKGKATYYADYFQYEDANQSNIETTQQTEATDREKLPSRRLSKAEEKERKQIESQITKAEAELKAAKAKLEDASVATDPIKLTEAAKVIEAKQKLVDDLFERWTELESSLAPTDKTN